jgi:hypothetical protein
MLVCSAACTAFEPGDDELPDTQMQELSPSELAAAAAPVAPTDGWACLVDDGAVQAPFTDESRGFVYTVRIETLFGDVPTNTVVRACSTADLDCTQPVTPNLPVDERGVVEVPLYWGFDGYLEIRADGIIPSVSYLREPIYADSVQSIPVQVAPLDALAAYAAANGTTLRNDRALLAVEVFDCNWELAAGVEVSNDAGGVAFSFTNGLPTIGMAVTDGRGLAGALNVPPGVVRAAADIVSTGQRVAARTINARAGWTSAVALVPASLLRPPE